MMIRSKLKLLAVGSIVVMALAWSLSWWGYQTIQTQQQHQNTIERLHAAIVDLNIFTLDLLQESHTHLQPSQWQTIYHVLGKEIADNYLLDQLNYQHMLDRHRKIGQRFEALQRAFSVCQKKPVTSGFIPDYCKLLEGRLRTQIRVALQDLLVEADKIKRRVISQSQRQYFIVGMLLLTLLTLLSLVTVPSALHMVRSLGSGLTRMLEASERFSQGDYGFRLKTDAKDEMGALSRTYNSMAQRREQAEESLRKSEAHLRTLVETIPDLVWLKSVDGVYLSCNRTFERLYGAREEDIVGKTDYDFVDTELADFFRWKDKEAMAAGGPCVNEEMVTFADDGHRALLETIKMPLRDDNGQFIGILGIARDITDRRQTEEALRRTQKMDAIGQVTGGIAHDFNNILGIIIGNLGFLKRLVEKDEEAQKRVETANRAALRAADLTKQLLGFSRRQAQNAIAIDINQVIQGMNSLIARSVTPEVEVEHYPAEELWLTEIDPGDFEDALLNLILNARDAMPEGGKLNIETSNKILDIGYCARNPSVSPGEYVQLAVSDTGKGIPANTIDRIFEPFFTTKPQGKGTGLGLSMVFGFAHRSNGHIKAYSEAGIGTTIRLYLPRIQSVEDKVRLPVDENIGSLPQGHETILVVDDEEGLLELAETTLQELGYSIITASSGRQALERLEQSQNIGLLFSDVVMPGGMNGYELAERATASHPQIKVLLTSGFTSKTVARNGQARFQADLLPKPYTPADLAICVRRKLDEK